ncbi:MAG: type II toxin-antitoxin system Phd/YefM family antitoxin [Alphaproteobacteria bacterium]|nr:type II toxin-antitoxin system Phd/YefM family antitoxin [Alphaproteobacteria bacterium]
MPAHYWSLQDAKNSFSAVVAAAINGAPQTVTKRGKPAVVVLSVAEYQRLSQREAAEAGNFVDHLLAMPQDDGVFERGRVKPRNIDF